MVPAEEQQTQKKPAAVVTGRTPKGVAFTVPPTRDMFRALRTPSCWGPSELITLLFSLQIVASVLLVRRIPYPFYVAQFLFWRLAYNVGIGLLLRAQSNGRVITNWLTSRDASTHALLRWAVTKSLPPDTYDWAAVPPSFNAWLAFRALATLILTNDGLSYLALVVASHSGPPPTALGKLCFAFVLAPLAALLTVFGTWAKASAHVVLSDFAWFWGDFFFTVDANLSFDGVFNLVPHPMYTAGYGAYYAAALITRSHALFQVSLLAHVAQLLFLALVEHPHICKTYPPSDPPATDATAAADAANTESRAAFMRDFEYAAPSPHFRAALTTGVGALTVLLALGRTPAVLLVIAVLGAHAAHWLMLAHQLAPADKAAESRVLATTEGSGRRAALVALRYSVLVSNAVRHGLFAACAARLMPGWVATTAGGRSAALLGAVMLALCGQGWRTAVADVGALAASHAEYLRFNGADADKDAGRARSDGATTRFLSRPLLVLPYATYYAAALAARSPIAALVAALAQAMHLAFARQMHRRYAAHAAASPTATVLERTLLRLPGVGVACGVLVGATDRCADALSDLASVARVRVERGQADAAKQRDVAVGAVESKLREIGQRAVASAPDGQRCVSELRRRGLAVTDVGPMKED